MKAKNLSRGEAYDGGVCYSFMCPYCNRFQYAYGKPGRDAAVAGTIGVIAGALIAGPLGAAILGGVGAAGPSLIGKDHTCENPSCGKVFTIG